MSKNDCKVSIFGNVRGVGKLDFESSADAITRVAGMALYSRFDAYQPIELLDESAHVQATLTYIPAADDDTLAVKSTFKLEITRTNVNDAGETTSASEVKTIPASDTCAPRDVQTLKARLLKEEVIKDASKELTADVKEKYAAELHREPRSNYWHGLEHAIKELYPSEASVSTSAETKSDLKATNEVSRQTFIRIARKQGLTVPDDISLKDVQALFE